MQEEAVYTVKVEGGKEGADGRPSVGPVYRGIYAEDGLVGLEPGMESPWQFFRSLSLSLTGGRRRNLVQTERLHFLAFLF